jgi:predicted dehydrogenase
MSRTQMNVGVLGLGFMGATHASAWRHVPGVTLAAVMSSDERKLAGDLTAIEGNLGNSGERLDFSGVQKYRTVEAVLADPAIDVIDICLPTDLHAPVALAALRAGKHVLVEKPIALNFADASAVIRQAETSGRILMAGQVLRFAPAYKLLAESLKTSGPLRSAFFRRRCSAPAWGRWLADPARSGGGVFDLLIHDADFCISLWGMPRGVRATGFEDMPAGIDILHAELDYPGQGPVIVTGGWHHPGAYPFSMEFTVVAQEATFEWPFGAPELREYRIDGSAPVHALPATDIFAAELTYFAECVRHKLPPALCPPEQSAQSVALMRFMLESRAKKGELVACLI